MIEKVREMDPKPWSEWTKDDISRFFGMKELGEHASNHSSYPIKKCQCASAGILTTVLIGVIIENNIWVASFGNSEGRESTFPLMPVE